jgi:hypothetical protein
MGSEAAMRKHEMGDWLSRFGEIQRSMQMEADSKQFHTFVLALDT